jgi:hypothetical protein
MTMSTLSAIRHKLARLPIISLFAVLVVTLSVGESAGARSSAASNAPIRIGFSITETGPDAAPPSIRPMML